MEKTKTINIGKKNSTFQHLLAIKTNRTQRLAHNEMYVEGVRNINLAIKYGWRVKHWVFRKNLSAWAKEKIENNKTQENYCLSDELMAELSGKTDTSELVAIFEIKKCQLRPGKNPVIVLFDRPSKKGNLGTIIRSADAFNVDGILVCGHGVDIYDPEIIVSSMGSYFATNLVRLETNEEIVATIKQLKTQFPTLKVVATTELGDENIRKFDFTTPILLLVGNENAGLSKFLLDLADYSVKIPMAGEASSFNVACATSIFLYEIFTSRNF